MMLSNQFRLFVMVLVCTFTMMHVQQGHAQFAKGADVSWLTEMESSGYAWYNDNGSQQDLFQILKDHGMNAIRLRVWVNPSGGWCNMNDMVSKAVRAKNAGMDILVTIHYSDTWADPGNQSKPSAWRSLSFQALMDRVWTYTRDVVQTLQSNGVTPKWVQIGNETNDGMLWEDGRASANMQNYAWLVTTGHNAVKDVNSSIMTVVHVSNAYDNSLFRWNIGGLIDNGAQFDVIGMSLYPQPGDWQSLNIRAYSNMNDMRSRYGKEVMISEVGMRADQPETCRSFLADIISKTRSAGGLGVFYWEPQVYNGWKGYGLGAWEENGRPSVAMDAFLEGSGSSSSSGGTCTPTPITPYLQLDGGSWQQTSSVTINSGSTVKFGPQSVSGGSWNWSGCGTSGSSREQTVSTSSSCIATAVYTNSCGAQSSQAFNITVSGSSSSSSSGGTYYQLRNRGTGLYLDGMGRTNNGDNVGQWANTTHVNSHWTLESTGGYYKLRNRGSGLYLDGMGRTGNGDACGQWASSSSYNQQWERVSTDGYYRFRNRATGLYLDGMGRTENGADVGQWANTSHVNSQWSLIGMSSGGKEVARSVDVAVYPNPAKDILNIVLPGYLEDKAEIMIFNAIGRAVMTCSLEAGQQTIDISGLPKGLYIIKTDNRAFNSSLRFVKE